MEPSGRPSPGAHQRLHRPSTLREGTADLARRTPCRVTADTRRAQPRTVAHQIRRAIVVDESGRCCGVVAQADIACKASAEKVGEMVREVSQPSEGASVH